MKAYILKKKNQYNQKVKSYLLVSVRILFEFVCVLMYVFVYDMILLTNYYYCIGKRNSTHNSAILIFEFWKCFILMMLVSVLNFNNIIRIRAFVLFWINSSCFQFILERVN